MSKRAATALIRVGVGTLEGTMLFVTTCAGLHRVNRPTTQPASRRRVVRAGVAAAYVLAAGLAFHITLGSGYRAASQPRPGSGQGATSSHRTSPPAKKSPQARTETFKLVDLGSNQIRVKAKTIITAQGKRPRFVQLMDKQTGAVVYEVASFPEGVTGCELRDGVLYIDSTESYSKRTGHYVLRVTRNVFFPEDDVFIRKVIAARRKLTGSGFGAPDTDDETAGIIPEIPAIKSNHWDLPLLHYGTRERLDTLLDAVFVPEKQTFLSAPTKVRTYVRDIGPKPQQTSRVPYNINDEGPYQREMEQNQVNRVRYYFRILNGLIARLDKGLDTAWVRPPSASDAGILLFGSVVLPIQTRKQITLVHKLELKPGFRRDATYRRELRILNRLLIEALIGSELWELEAL